MNTPDKNFRGSFSSLRYLIRANLWAQILIGLVLGIGVGLLLSPQGGGLVSDARVDSVAAWVAVPGHLFLAIIQMVVVPLVVASIVLGIGASSDTAALKRIGLRIVPYFLCTTVIAVTLGLCLGQWIQPGRFVDAEQVNQPLNIETSVSSEAIDSANPGTEIAPTLADRVVEFIPTNLTVAVLERSMMQIVVFAIFLGVALLAIGQARAAALIELFRSIQEACMKIVGWAMAIAPVAVFSLLCSITTQIGLNAIVSMAAYVLTVIAGLSALLLVYLLIVAVIARRSPWKFLSDIRAVQLLAFSTSSSAAVMPLTISTAEKKLGVSPSIAQFTVPLGATVNMDGTAVYQAIATVFLAQVYGIEMTTGTLILVAASTVGASIGAPSTPGVGIVILATILQQAGIPASGIALILGVDRILDMLRTTVNVTGDLTACLVMDRWMGHATADSREHRPPVEAI